LKNYEKRKENQEKAIGYFKWSRKESSTSKLRRNRNESKKRRWCQRGERFVDSGIEAGEARSKEEVRSSLLSK
jgi:hypothetical protein